MWISEFDDNLVYRVSSRTARVTQRNPKQNKKTSQPSATTDPLQTLLNGRALMLASLGGLQRHHTPTSEGCFTGMASASPLNIGGSAYM